MSTASTPRHTLNELLVGLFQYILYIEERNIRNKGFDLSMNDVHILENIAKASDNSMSHIAARIMVTQGTMSTNISRLIKKGYVVKYRDDADKRVQRLINTNKAKPVLEVHDEFHKNMIDKVIKAMGLEENEILNESLERILAYFREQYSDVELTRPKQEEKAVTETDSYKKDNVE